MVKKQKVLTMFKRYTAFTLSFKSARNGLGDPTPAHRSRSARGALCGFTLAEVLVTLTIIGIVAAITIPGFISEHQKHTYITGFKKAYSEGNQALQKAAIKNCGTNDISCIFNASPSITTIGNILSAEYNVVKICRPSGATGCIKPQAWDYTGTDVMSLEGGAYYNFVTADGMGIKITQLQPYCGLDASLTPGSLTTKVCGEFWVDVNGKKGPNYLGRDTYRFYITSNNTALLYPYGGRETNPGKTGTEARGGGGWWNYNNGDYCGTNSNKRGYICAGRIMEKGWVMDY